MSSLKKFYLPTPFCLLIGLGLAGCHDHGSDSRPTQVALVVPALDSDIAGLSSALVVRHSVADSGDRQVPLRFLRVVAGQHRDAGDLAAWAERVSLDHLPDSSALLAAQALPNPPADLPVSTPVLLAMVHDLLTRELSFEKDDTARRELKKFLDERGYASPAESLATATTQDRLLEDLFAGSAVDLDQARQVLENPTERAVVEVLAGISLDLDHALQANSALATATYARILALEVGLNKSQEYREAGEAIEGDSLGGFFSGVKKVFGFAKNIVTGFLGGGGGISGIVSAIPNTIRAIGDLVNGGTFGDNIQRVEFAVGNLTTLLQSSTTRILDAVAANGVLIERLRQELQETRTAILNAVEAVRADLHNESLTIQSRVFEARGHLTHLALVIEDRINSRLGALAAATQAYFSEERRRDLDSLVSEVFSRLEGTRSDSDWIRSSRDLVEIVSLIVQESERNRAGYRLPIAAAVEDIGWWLTGATKMDDASLIQRGALFTLIESIQRAVGGVAPALGNPTWLACAGGMAMQIGNEKVGKNPQVAAEVAAILQPLLDAAERVARRGRDSASSVVQQLGASLPAALQGAIEEAARLTLCPSGPRIDASAQLLRDVLLQGPGYSAAQDRARVPAGGLSATAGLTTGTSRFYWRINGEGPFYYQQIDPVGWCMQAGILECRDGALFWFIPDDLRFAAVHGQTLGTIMVTPQGANETELRLSSSGGALSTLQQVAGVGQQYIDTILRETLNQRIATSDLVQTRRFYGLLTCAATSLGALLTAAPGARNDIENLLSTELGMFVLDDLVNKSDDAVDWRDVVAKRTQTWIDGMLEHGGNEGVGYLSDYLPQSHTQVVAQIDAGLQRLASMLISAEWTTDFMKQAAMWR